MSDGSHAPVLEGRVVVVTEPAVARAVADAGAAVVLVSREGAPSEADDGFAAAVTDLEAQGRRVVRFVGDLGDAETRAALAEMIAELFAVEDLSERREAGIPPSSDRGPAARSRRRQERDS